MILCPVPDVVAIGVAQVVLGSRHAQGDEAAKQRRIPAKIGAVPSQDVVRNREAHLRA